ncbi:S1C family serine protease [Kovacikia minuta CCNUW1]|uniref:S1C family serine protease n=1 Tax=Kovacikia minuta TaxID=2931930 RepID=UPI001CCE95D7|nr:trypsin-like peptidase domain-containing protein [Kovacikia minuta]UBF24861.1 S1C family serine protease [Kovacikia minuta CCNUW1]
MKLVPWILTAVLLVLARAFATGLPSEQNSSSPKEEPPAANVQQPVRSTEPSNGSSDPFVATSKRQSQSDLQTNKGDCKSAGPAVVTIRAGRSFGSGSIVSSDGLVITNNHVVRPAMGASIGVRTISGGRYQGQVIGVDQVNDLALIKLNTQDRLPAIPIANSQSLQLGQKVCAIGSPYGQPGVLTRGTLTTIRSNGDLQSALVLEPGNSGGPLLNQQGEMIGVNKAIWQSRNGVNSGISFATNLTIAKNFIAQNRSNTGTIASRPGPDFGYPGSSMMPSQPEGPPFSPDSPFPHPGMEGSSPFSGFPPHSPGGEFDGPSGEQPFQRPGPRLGVMLDNETMTIREVMPRSAAGAAGIRPGDQLLALNGSQVQGVEQVEEFLSNNPNSAKVTIKRNQQTQDIQVNFQ